MKKNNFSFIIKKNLIKLKKPKIEIINLYYAIKFLFIIIIMAFIISHKYYKSKIENLNKNFHKMFLYKEDEKINLNNKNLINICLSLDNNIIYPTLVSMTSALENNNNKKNILSFNLLLSSDFNKENIQIFESLKKNYPIIINYYIIPNIFDSFKPWNHGTYCHYYKIINYSYFVSLFRKNIIS